MTKLSLLNIDGKKIKDIELNKEVWAIEPNKTVLYDAITLAQGALRQGTHSVKNRSAVSGGGSKPRPQKGSGRSRQGTIRAPQWRGGGVVFGPTPRSYSKKMNRKERRLALRSALSLKLTEDRLVGLDSLKLVEGKTKTMVAILENLKLDNKVLFVTEEIDANTYLASRNLRGVLMMTPDEINVLDIVDAEYLVVTENAVAMIEEVLA